MRRLIALIFCLALFFTCSALADASENQEIIYTYLTETLSLSRAAACGILSNIKSESGFRPEAVGDNGNAYGICQWNSRRQSLVKYCEENGFESWESLEGQLGYLAYELSNNKKSVGAYLSTIPDTAQGAYDAAWYFCVYYEIPADRYSKAETRGKNAVNTYFKHYGGSVSTYKITYNANGGSSAPAAGTKTEGLPFYVSSAAPVKAGYQLAGWSEDKNGRTTVYQGGDTFKENRDATLYAIWERSLDADTAPDAQITVNGHTYEYYSGAFSWKRAQEFAAVKGAYLASVRTSAEYSAVAQLISQADGPCWLGGKYGNGNWTWLSGESFSDEFAASHWQEGSPAAIVGASERGCLAQTPDGHWLDLASDSLEARGIVIETGAVEAESFPVYLVIVSSSLRLREGPGTEYDSLSYLYPGMYITIRETALSGSSQWGWGVTDSGSSGWCSMKSSYLTPVDWLDSATGLACRNTPEGVCLLGLTGSVSSLDIPATLGGRPVVAIARNAFTGDNAPAHINIPASVVSIEKGAFAAQTVIRGWVGSAAHLAAAADQCVFDMILPENGISGLDAVTVIEPDAFRDDALLAFADLSQSSLEIISSGAFRDCPNLSAVILPASVTSIADDAFDSGVVLVCPADSYAAAWAQAHGIATVAP